MEKKSLYNLTKGTPFEKMIDTLAAGEAKGAGMYYALARLAREQGLDDVAEKLTEAGNQEANHSGFFAVLNGKYPQDFWALLRGLQAAETGGEGNFMKFAEQLRAAGLDVVADELEVFAKQEGGHGKLLKQILEENGKYVEKPDGDVYVCGVCGFEYVGDLDAEPDDYVCPLCGMPKKVFRKKETE